MLFNTTSLNQERQRLIGQYTDLEPALQELINDLVAQKANPGNLLLIETALEGKFSTSHTLASNPQAELATQLQALHYPHLAIKASTGVYNHAARPFKIESAEIAFDGKRMASC